MKKYIAAVVVLALLAGACSAAEPLVIDPVQVGVDSITADELEVAIRQLADPVYKGRRADTPESAAIAETLSQSLKGSGFAPIDEDYLQEFCLFDDVAVTGRDYQIWNYFRANGWNVPKCAANVAGIYPGTTKADEYIVLVAHRDHTGVNPSRIPADDADPAFDDDDPLTSINLGADDNATGVAALLEIAEAVAVLADAGYRFERSIIILFADAEEFGLWGSRYFTEHPPVPLEQIVTVINVDMLGRNAPEHLQVIGSPELADFAERNPDLAVATFAAAKLLGFEVAYPKNEGAEKGVFGRSDHYSFFAASPADARIPVVFFSAGLHDDYHRPTDTADTINFTKVRRIAQLALLVAWQISEMDGVPDYVE